MIFPPFYLHFYTVTRWVRVFKGDVCVPLGIKERFRMRPDRRLQVLSANTGSTEGGGDLLLCKLSSGRENTPPHRDKISYCF